MQSKGRWLLAVGLAFPLLAAQAANDKTVRATEYGFIEGISDKASNTWAWKGIPYASPPVGDLRWRAPTDPAKWNNVRSTAAFGPACAQYGRIYGPGANNRYDETIASTLNQAVGSEDCLYLNIWRPATGKSDLPVIVFFHGGSNVSGYTADPMYDGGNLAKTTNSIVVTVNFRLGVFGFFSLPQLKEGADPDTTSGNFAILDSIKSLEFLKRNIGNFGGDPNNITIMGESAGAINVYALLTSPKLADAQTKPFHKAVAMSGGLSLATNLPQGTIPTMSPASVYEAQGSALLSNLLIDDGKATSVAEAQAYVASQTQPQIAAYMRSKTPAQIFRVLLTKLAAAGLSGSGPIPDGSVVSGNPVGAINTNKYVQVPVLAGNTRDEGKLFPSFLPLVSGIPGSARIVTDAELFMNHFGYRPEDAPQTTIQQWIAPGYLPADAPVTGFTARADQFNRIFFLASRDNILNALKAKQADVWYYRFDWDEQPAPWNVIYGAAHLFDLPFVFGNFGPSLMANIMNTSANRAGRLELSDAMMRSIGTFARRGDPNNDSLDVHWPMWPSGLIFDATQTRKNITVQKIPPALP
ncbi:carboxylesterase/lipase family protein [Noviherbaspirillum malthae]|uniref:carboxylesterase/lipase family protein n=1 Tax=Noviherbaspirillum malthae TaxID=1260987 RepID=UPI001890333F|nr:carboxylesterase family protein [Noviherbaspirillum malthae]